VLSFVLTLNIKSLDWGHIISKASDVRFLHVIYLTIREYNRIVSYSQRVAYIISI